MKARQLARQLVKISAVALLLSPASVLAATLPDLVPADLRVDADCRIVVTLKNNGPGIVPDAGFSMSPPGSSGVQMYKGGAPWGGIVLGAMDPSKQTQPAGGTVTYTWFPGLALPPGAHVVKVDVDNNNSIKESNEQNNSLTKKLACRKPLPDLVPTNISVNSECQIVITLKNNGSGIVPDAGFSLSAPGSSGVQMYSDGAPWGGIVLGGLDPSKQLQPVGGTITHTWFPGAANLKLPPGAHVVEVVVDNNNSIVESNDANNSLKQKVSCGHKPPVKRPTLKP